MGEPVVAKVQTRRGPAHLVTREGGREGGGRGGGRGPLTSSRAHFLTGRGPATE